MNTSHSRDVLIFLAVPHWRLRGSCTRIPKQNLDRNRKVVLVNWQFTIIYYLYKVFLK